MDGMAAIERHYTHYQSHEAYRGPDYIDSRISHHPLPRLQTSQEIHEALQRDSSATPSSTSNRLSPHPWDTYRCRQSPPHSQALRSQESSRPSLPSLRTVLGENTRSPQVDVHKYGSSLQPRPREPAYDPSTYKPPALYPNKRSRTDSGWDGQETDRKTSEVSSTSLHFINNRQDDRNSQQLELPILSSSSPSVYRHRHAESTLSAQPMPLSHPASPECRGRPVHLPASPSHRFDTQPRYNLPHHRLPHLRDSRRDVDMDGTLPCVAGGNRSPSLSLAEEDARRASLYGRANPQQPYLQDDSRQSMVPTANPQLCRDEYPSSVRLDVPRGYNSPTFAYTQAFFVPSHYEYQNGKSRKRSNLPKQSTEIMKRWFDDNLQNPYPSEEQKRHFAAVAGINLTQVSNWFINHRRRCPELREKRDKGRAGSGDESG